MSSFVEHKYFSTRLGPHVEQPIQKQTQKLIDVKQTVCLKANKDEQHILPFSGRTINMDVSSLNKNQQQQSSSSLINNDGQVANMAMESSLIQQQPEIRQDLVIVDKRMHYTYNNNNNNNNKHTYSSDIFEDDSDDDWTIIKEQKTVNNDVHSFQNFLWIHQGTLEAEDFKFF